MMAPKADSVAPMCTTLLPDERVPLRGRMRVPDRPRFGVCLSPDCSLLRSDTH